jgi:hypothetical protein
MSYKLTFPYSDDDNSSLYSDSNHQDEEKYFRNELNSSIISSVSKIIDLTQNDTDDEFDYVGIGKNNTNYSPNASLSTQDAKIPCTPDQPIKTTSPQTPIKIPKKSIDINRKKINIAHKVAAAHGLAKLEREENEKMLMEITDEERIQSEKFFQRKYRMLKKPLNRKQLKEENEKFETRKKTRTDSPLYVYNLVLEEKENDPFNRSIILTEYLDSFELDMSQFFNLSECLLASEDLKNVFEKDS